MLDAGISMPMPSYAQSKAGRAIRKILTKNLKKPIVFQLFISFWREITSLKNNTSQKR
jgi:hypothetical protein